MKKRAYTLAEILIALGIVGIISAIMIGLINKAAPDMNKIKYLQAHDALVKSVKAIAHDSSLYSNTLEYQVYDDAGVLYNTILKINKTPFFDTTKPTNPNFNDDTYSGVTKFDNLIQAALNGETLAANDDNFKFTTVQNNTSWQIQTTNELSSDYPIRRNGDKLEVPLVFYSEIMVDINGSKGPNMVYEMDNELAANGKAPDRFRFIVTANGKVYPNDLYGLYYLKTRRSWTKNKQVDLERYVSKLNTQYDLPVFLEGDAPEIVEDGEDPVDPPGPGPFVDKEYPLIHYEDIIRGDGTGGSNNEPQDGDYSDVSGSDLDYPSREEMEQALSSNYVGASKLNNGWGYYYKYTFTGNGNPKTFRNEAKTTINLKIDALYNDLVSYYTNNYVSDNVHSQLTHNYVVTQNKAFLARLAYTRDTLKHFYAKLIDGVVVPSDSGSGIDGGLPSIYTIVDIFSFYDEEYKLKNRQGKYVRAHGWGIENLKTAYINWLVNNQGMGYYAQNPQNPTYGGAARYTTGTTGLVFMMDSVGLLDSSWYFMYGISHPQLLTTFLGIYDDYTDENSFSDRFIISHIANPTAVRNAYQGTTQLSYNGNNGDHYFGELSSAVTSAKNQMNTLIDSIANTMLINGYSVDSVNYAKQSVKDYYTSVLNQVNTDKSTITGLNSPANTYITLSQLTPAQTVGAIKKKMVSDCNSSTGPSYGNTGILVRYAWGNNGQGHWRIDAKKSTVVDKLINEATTHIPRDIGRGT